MEHRAIHLIIRTALTCFGILIMDFLLYGEIFPLLALYVGCYISAHFNCSYLAELFYVAGLSLLFFFVSLALRLEKMFWKKLYTLEGFYKYVLHARDGLNAISVAIFVATLVNTTFNTSLLASVDKSKEDTILEHPIEGFRHVVCYRLEFYSMKRFSWCDDEYKDTSYEAIYEAKVLYAVAFLSISVAKMLYFNTLFTYLQTLKMFRDLQAARASQQREAENRRQLNNRRRRPRPVPVPASGHPRFGPQQQETQNPIEEAP